VGATRMVIGVSLGMRGGVEVAGSLVGVRVLVGLLVGTRVGDAGRRVAVGAGVSVLAGMTISETPIGVAVSVGVGGCVGVNVGGVVGVRVGTLVGEAGGRANSVGITSTSPEIITVFSGREDANGRITASPTPITTSSKPIPRSTRFSICHPRCHLRRVKGPGKSPNAPSYHEDHALHTPQFPIKPRSRS
jgi:hypothetical protein